VAIPDLGNRGLRNPALTVDGSLLAVPAAEDFVEGIGPSAVWLVSTATMTIIDADGEAEGDQPVALPARPHDLSFDASGAFLYVANRDDEETPPLHRVTIADYTITEVTGIDNGLRSDMVFRDPSGQIWFSGADGMWGESPSLHKVTGTTATAATGDIGRFKGFGVTTDGQLFNCGGQRTTVNPATAVGTFLSGDGPGYDTRHYSNNCYLTR
jgi:hypothetical protein